MQGRLAARNLAKRFQAGGEWLLLVLSLAFPLYSMSGVYAKVRPTGSPHHQIKSY
jgi:hypothetical protein